MTQPLPPVSKIGFVGASRFTLPVVRWILSKGYPVVWVDQNVNALEESLALFRVQMSEEERLGERTHALTNQLASLLSGSISLLDLVGCDLVIDGTRDHLEGKVALARSLEELLGDRVLLGVFLESLTVSHIASRIIHPQRLIGLRPVGLPPRILQSFEIISGVETEPECVTRMADFSRMLNLEPAIVREGPGGIVNRLLARLFSEALLLPRQVREEHDAVDRALGKSGLSLFPFEMMRKLGEVEVSKMITFFRRYYGPSFPLSEGLPLQSAVVSGDIHSDADSFIRKVTHGGTTITLSDWADGVFLALTNEAVQIVSEGVSDFDTVDRITRIAFLGENATMGLLAKGAKRGWPLILNGLWDYSHRTDGRIWPSSSLQLWAAASRSQVP
jgi:3-hydroxybutyryl-CoA dehydrogenase